MGMAGFVETSKNELKDTLSEEILESDKDGILVLDEASQGVMFHSHSVLRLLENPAETALSMSIFAPIDKGIFSGPIFDCHETNKKLENTQACISII